MWLPFRNRPLPAFWLRRAGPCQITKPPRTTKYLKGKETEVNRELSKHYLNTINESWFCQALEPSAVISHSKGKQHTDVLLIKATFHLLKGIKADREEQNIQQESHIECSPVLYILTEYVSTDTAHKTIFMPKYRARILHHIIYQRGPFCSVTELQNDRNHAKIGKVFPSNSTCQVVSC